MLEFVVLVPSFVQIYCMYILYIEIEREGEREMSAAPGVNTAARDGLQRIVEVKFFELLSGAFGYDSNLAVTCCHLPGHGGACAGGA